MGGHWTCVAFACASAFAAPMSVADCWAIVVVVIIVVVVVFDLAIVGCSTMIRSAPSPTQTSTKSSSITTRVMHRRRRDDDDDDVVDDGPRLMACE